MNLIGVYVYIKRDGQGLRVDLDQLTDSELADLVISQPEVGWDWARTFAKWIRVNVREVVPRDHCNRCDRCGFTLASTREAGCRPRDCSMRPMPEPRPTCAGCGTPFAYEALKHEGNV